MASRCDWQTLKLYITSYHADFDKERELLLKEVRLYILFVIPPILFAIYTTIGDACVCVFAKLDQFLPVRSHFDTKRPVNIFHIATFPSPTFGPLFAFHCPLFFTKNNNLHAAMF